MVVIFMVFLPLSLVANSVASQNAAPKEIGHAHRAVADVPHAGAYGRGRNGTAAPAAVRRPRS